MALSDYDRSVRQRLKDDFEHYALKCLRIRNKRGRIVPFVLNKAQRYIHNKLEQQLVVLGRIRALFLKGRQQGCSTYAEGRFYWKTTHHHGQRAFILTHEQDATDNLFDMAERFHEHCPSLLRPNTGKANAKELYFDVLDSGYKVGTARNKATGRSSTIQYFHGSEVAQWQNADMHKAGIMQAIPEEPGTEIILESTAFGVGGMFHEMWLAAEATADGTAKEEERTDYIPIFVPWYWQTEYSRAVYKGFILSKYEKLLKAEYGLTNEQLAWRRFKISELKPSDGGNPEDLFKQEYPFTPEEAFLFSGRPVFDTNQLLTAAKECYSPKYRADIELSTGKVVKMPQGALRVWEEPRPGKKYVIGADVAEGLEHGDFSCADVYEIPSRNSTKSFKSFKGGGQAGSRLGYQVAQWHGHIDPDRYGTLLIKLGLYYRKAFIGVERNNHGLTTLTTMKRKGYSNLYVQEDIERRAEGHQTKRAGWLTTKKSKHKIIDQLSAELRDEEHGIVCEDTIKEMSTFVIHEDGSIGAKPGSYDDRVIARAIAGEMLYAAPRGRRS